jgi:hypothetical protein
MSKCGCERNAVGRFPGLEVGLICSEEHVGSNESIVVRWWLEVLSGPESKRNEEEQRCKKL